MERLSRPVMCALAVVLVAALGFLWHNGDKKNQPEKSPEALFDPTDAIVRDSCLGRTMQGAGWVLPIQKDGNFTVKVVDRFLEDPHHANAYIEFTLTYGVSKIEGLGAVRYEKVENIWYARFVDALDVHITEKPKDAEKPAPNKQDDKK
jgi:hypothetical protein